MASVINDPLATQWLDLLKAKPCFASLHFEEPNPDDPGASEVDGATYSRATLTWTYAPDSTRALVNLQDLVWKNIEQITLVAVGVWDAPTKGNLLLWAQLDAPVPVPDRGSFQVDALELFVSI
jgi:hypothetical protein